MKKHVEPKWKWGVQYVCNICGEKVKGKNNFRCHKKLHYEKDGYKCRFCGKTFSRNYQVAAHTARCRLNPNYDCTVQHDGERSKKRQSDGLTDEHKQKISSSMKRFFREHPESLSYKYNHYSKGSWAEDYFADVFDRDNKKGFIRQYRCGTYRLDFAFPLQKIDFEVDGHQHSADMRIVEHDKKRTAYLEGIGWKVIRVKWGDFKKLTKDGKKEWLANFLYPYI